MSNLITKIKALFNEANPTPVESKMKDVKTADGLILRIEDTIVSILNEDGTITLAPAGQYTLEDGTYIDVAADGKLVPVEAKAEEVKVEKEVEVETEEKEAEMADAEKKAETDEDAGKKAEKLEEVPVQEDKIPALEAKISELEAAIAIIVEQMATMTAPAEAEMKEVKKENKELKKQVKELAAAPAKAESTFSKVEMVSNIISEKSGKAVKNSPSMLNKVLELKENK